MKPKLEVISGPDPIAQVLKQLRARTGEPWRIFLDRDWEQGPCSSIDLFGLFSDRVEPIQMQERTAHCGAAGVLTVYFIRERLAERFVEFVNNVYIAMPNRSVTFPTHRRVTVGGFANLIDLIGFRWCAADNPAVVEKRQQLASIN